MTERYKLGTFLQNEDLHQKARVPYLAAYKIKYPNSQTRIAKNYTDRITGEIKDTVIQLSTNGKDHSDRLSDPIKHPDYPTTNKTLLSYDDEKEDDDLKTAYYYNLIACVTLGCDPAIINLSKEEAQAQGFFPEEV